MDRITANRFMCAIVLLVFVMLSSGCGGGGGDGDDDGAQTLGVYDFNLSFLADTPLQIDSNSGAWIRLEARSEEDTQILGSYDLDNEIITLDSGYGVKATTNIWGDGSGLPIYINLESDLSSEDGEHPTTGSVAVYVEDPVDPYTINMSIDTVGSDTTVDLENTLTSATADFDWNVFEDLFWDPEAPDWVRQASYAWYVLNFYFYQVDSVTRTIYVIEQNDDTFPSGTVIVNGETYPPDGGTAGTIEFICADGDGGPGSSYSQVFTNFWENDPENNIDELIEGTVDYVGFLENIDQDRDVITSIGFVPDSGEGGVFYDDPGLTITEVEETSPDVFEETSWYTITGRYTIMFYEQDQ